MDIGTGKDLDEYRGAGGDVAYHCIDIADPSDIYTVFQYQRDCIAAIRDIRFRHKLPVLCGGTGLYIESVLRGYRIAGVAEDAALRSVLMKESTDELDKRLKSADTLLYERTDRSSRKRLVRALEIAASRAAGNVHEDRDEVESVQLEPLVLCVRWPREELIARIDMRVEQRLTQGMVEEVRRLLESGLSAKRFAMFGMEYRHVAMFLDGYTSYENMVRNLKTDIHRLAKRQMTWFRGMERRGVAMEWVERGEIESAMKAAAKYPCFADGGRSDPPQVI
jgi:tRNA dimethylallyltransferase